MTDLTRERLAELRGIAEKARETLGDSPWYEPRGGGQVFVGETDAAHIAAFPPAVVLTLIAQCEAGLPASGGVSGDRGLEIQIETMTTISARREEQFFKCREERSALLAERDGLKTERDDLDHELRIANGYRAGAAEANAALADALGLLRVFAKRHDALSLGHALGHISRQDLVDAHDFLAKHGKTEEAKTSDAG